MPLEDQEIPALLSWEVAFEWLILVCALAFSVVVVRDKATTMKPIRARIESRVAREVREGDMVFIRSAAGCAATRHGAGAATHARF